MPKLGHTPAAALPLTGLDRGLVAIHTHSLCLREVVVVPEDVLFICAGGQLVHEAKE